MKRKIIFMVFVVIISLCTLCVAEEKQTNDSPGQAIFVMATPVEVQLDNKVIQSTTDNLVINIQIPQLRGIEDKVFEKKVNKYFEKRGKILKKEASKLLKSQGMVNSQTPYEMMSHFNVKESIDNLLVIHFLDYVYTGADKGVATPSYVVLDLKGNKHLTLQELFCNTCNYKKQISELLTKEFKERHLTQYITNDTFFEQTVFKPQENFYIDEKGNLVIVIKMYHLSPTLSGYMTFVLDKDQLSHYKINEDTNS